MECASKADRPVLDTIRDTILSIGRNAIEFIVLFGSRARGTASQRSDTDIAVKTNLTDASERWDLLLSLVSSLNGPRKRVDIVMVEDANWSLKYRIARDGVVLFAREGAWERFLTDVMIYYPDYAIFEREFLGHVMRAIRNGD